jgi:hypothetical protein
MLFPTPSLDDYDFQKIVDEAKRLIPRYCPEWTDHNVSDPGVALIELFAWMTDLLIYRVNQTPDRMYLKFLELIGMSLEPVSAALVPVTFYLKGEQTEKGTLIRQGTQVSTPRTETQEPILFTTIESRRVKSPRFQTLFYKTEDGDWERKETAALADGLRAPVILFPEKKALMRAAELEEGAFYLTFAQDCRDYVLEIEVENATAEGINIDSKNPPMQWEVYSDGEGWIECVVESDETEGFNRKEGRQILLRLPPHMSQTNEPREGPKTEGPVFWLRCILKKKDPAQRGYKSSPRILGLKAASRGITILAEHSTEVLKERLGFSSGEPGQMFPLRHTPILPLYPDETRGDSTEESEQDEENAERASLELQDLLDKNVREQEELEREEGLPAAPPERISVENARDQSTEEWRCVQDFTNSKAEHKHFMLDKVHGMVIFGPTLLQPDGKVYCFGKIPAKGSEIIFQRYRYGGGIAGNVAIGAISVLKESADSNIVRLTNWDIGRGGRNVESLDSARFRVPEFLRKPTQAVTARDYEAIARLSETISRAKCIAPREQQGGKDAIRFKKTQDGPEEELKPGEVLVCLVQNEPDRLRRISTVEVGADVQKEVRERLQERSVLGVKVYVQDAGYLTIRIVAEVVSYRSNHKEIQDKARRLLDNYLNPCSGGPDGMGWPFGKPLYHSEILGLLQRVPEIAYVQKAEIWVTNTARYSPNTPVKDGIVVLKEHEVLCSEEHKITIRQPER